MRIIKLSTVLLVTTAWMVFAVSPKTKRSGGPLSLDHSSLHVTELQGTVLSESDLFALPTAIAVVEDHLVLVDRFGEHVVHVLSRATGEIMDSFGRHGEGPGEFKVAYSIDPVPGEEPVFWIFDAGLQRLTCVRLHDADRRERPWESPILELHARGTVTNPVWVSDDALISLGFFLEGRLAKLDAAGNVTAMLGSLPEADREVPPNVLLHAYQGTMKPSPDRSRLAVVTRHAGFVEIYGAGGELVNRTGGPFPFEPRFEVKPGPEGPVMGSGRDLRFGYLDVATTGDRIYALFSGRTREGFPGRANYGEYVHLFNWSGEFEGALRLDAEAIAIAVDAEKRRLYAVRHLPQPGVLAYRLPAAGRL
ncbi:MAG: BF3164 family lipoprotein [Gemmatimonadota bacterium]